MEYHYCIEIPELKVDLSQKKKEVKLLQILLNANGFSCGSNDGIFGNKTLLAVQKVNAKYKINANYCNHDTWLALLNN